MGDSEDSDTTLPLEVTRPRTIAPWYSTALSFNLGLRRLGMSLDTMLLSIAKQSCRAKRAKPKTIQNLPRKSLRIVFFEYRKQKNAAVHRRIANHGLLSWIRRTWSFMLSTRLKTLSHPGHSHGMSGRCFASCRSRSFRLEKPPSVAAEHPS